MTSKREQEKGEVMAGISVLLGIATGIASLVVAGFAFFNANWVGAGACLAAAGLAFGLVANATLRS